MIKTLLVLKICAFLLVINNNIIFAARNRFRVKGLPGNITTFRPTIRDRVANRIQRHKERTTTTVCYDIVGCFEVPHSRSPLQKSPEPPEAIDTKFFLFRRNIKFSEPEVLLYDDNGASIFSSKFNYSQPLKIYIHGYMSYWNEKGAFLAADALLKLGDINFILMDWSKGARGPQYTSAAANTEVAGRQLGVLLMTLINRGLDPIDIHLIGFSLGAHVAGCASEWVKNNKRLIGRITGLDAAGPLFRQDHLKEKSKKLDKSDARFVDALHTDSSPLFVDGFGLWEPIGHVDFYANGGEEQPGCVDLQASILTTSLDKSLTKERACSHIRAYQLFLETLLNKVSGNPCEFIAYKCKGGNQSFKRGQCFPQIADRTLDPLALNERYYDQWGKFGDHSKGDGIMYFTTTGNSPYCGTQLQILVETDANTPLTQGQMKVRIPHGNSIVNFFIECDITSQNDYTFSDLAAAEYNSINSKVESMIAYVNYEHNEIKDHRNVTIPTGMFVNMKKVVLKDMHENIWSYCGPITKVGKTGHEEDNTAVLKLSKRQC